MSETRYNKLVYLVSDWIINNDKKYTNDIKYWLFVILTSLFVDKQACIRDEINRLSLNIQYNQFCY